MIASSLTNPRAAVIVAVPFGPDAVTTPAWLTVTSPSSEEDQAMVIPSTGTPRSSKAIAVTDSSISITVFSPPHAQPRRPSINAGINRRIG